MLSYGVCIPKTRKSEKDVLVECFSTQHRLHDRFVDSIIDCLSTSFSQISGYVHFIDAETANSALQINGGAIGVSSWLLTPEMNLETLRSVLLTLNLGHSWAIQIELVLDLMISQKQELEQADG